MKQSFASAAILFALATCGDLLAPATAADRPNILILFPDDQRADTIAALGNPDIITPNLDQIADRGFHASSAYCLGANVGAVCRPSRNMLLSGRTYFRWTAPKNGKPQANAPATDTTLPAVFNAAGYETYHHGKRGNTAQNIHRQFDHSHYLDDFNDRWSMQAGRKVIDDALSFLDARQANAAKSDSPWLMYLAFAMPHDPRAASEEALAMYDPDTLHLFPASRRAHPFDNGAVLVRDEWTAVWPRTEQVLRDQIHDYYAAITTLDQNIGRLIDRLRRDGELDNTLVVFSSDHGLGMGSHGLMGKQNVYEAGYKAPMVMAGPGIPHGTNDDPVYLMDLFPTLCELTGIAVPDGLDGESFAAMVREGKSGPRDAVLLSYTDTQRAIRQGDWKLIYYPQSRRTQLFNLDRDPNEQQDLSNDRSQSDRINSLFTVMKTLQDEQGDPLQIPVERQPMIEDDFIAPEIRLAKSGRPSLSATPSGLHSTELSGRQTGDPFSVLRPEDGYFAAVSVGLSRTAPKVVTGIRFDIVKGPARDADRWTEVVGNPQSRWTPLLDQMNPKRQPIGIYGAADGVLRRLGFIQTDTRIAPTFGGSDDGTPFEVRIPTETNTIASKQFAGFHGTVISGKQQTVIESLGLLYLPNGKN
ncbi:sulfatase-like hydrolase/transferase [Roseiconus lacunae]|uniref:sulfatase-like hydrolase/transferase n=1 Tax=Roseiconus lacunae TaxID=2605694 RepID=UPI00308C3A97|nr:sulfatase-like hydrolase/transferase [Stieleria sp. HD01]